MAKPAQSLRLTVTLEVVDEDGRALSRASQVRHLNGHRIVLAKKGEPPLHVDSDEGAVGMSAQRLCREVYRDLLVAIVDPDRT